MNFVWHLLAKTAVNIPESLRLWQSEMFRDVGFITRFCFGSPCKQLVFKFLFLRQRPFWANTQPFVVSWIFSRSDRKQEVQHSEKISQQYRGKSSSCHSSFSSTPSIRRRASVVATDSWRSRLGTKSGGLQTSGRCLLPDQMC